jgi:hypothetical protein
MPHLGTRRWTSVPVQSNQLAIPLNGVDSMFQLDVIE